MFSNNFQSAPNTTLFNSDPKALKYIAYVRKSTEEADRQAMSIEAQINAIKSQFPKLDITFIADSDGVVGESMSAAKPGRPLFNQMVEDLESGKYQGIVAWHPDRLSRNAPDASRIVWGIQQGIIKDLKFCNFYFESTPEGIMMLQMIMSQAQYFSAKLSKDIRRGNALKRRHGGVNYVPPIGYINNREKRTIEVDPERFDMVRKAFDLMLTGNYSAKEICNIMNFEWGLRRIKRKNSGGNPVSHQALCRMFKNKFYAGIIVDTYTKEEFQGQHPPMISLEEYERIQDILAGKPQAKVTDQAKNFPLRGFIRCGECGCMITAENRIKHQKNGNVHKYVYYRCTHKSKTHKCSQKAIREAELYRQLEELLDSYEITPELYRWGIRAIKEMSEKEINDRNEVQQTQNKAIVDIEKQLDNLLDLVTKNIIDVDKYKEKSASLEKQLAKLQKEQAETTKRVKSWYEIIGTTLEQLDSITDKFNKGDVADKRRVLSALGSDPILIDGKVTLKEHFWLKPIKENKEKVISDDNKVRTCPQQIKNASEEARYQLWWSVRDSNS